MITSTTFSSPSAIKKTVLRSRTGQSAALTANVIRFVAALPGQVRHRLRVWNRRGEERAFLASLQEFELRAMGLSLDQRDDEVNKPLWQA